jgi:hypothetical protein
METVKIDIIPNSESIGVQKLPSPSPVAISRAKNLPLTPAQLALLVAPKIVIPIFPMTKNSAGFPAITAD